MCVGTVFQSSDALTEKAERQKVDFLSDITQSPLEDALVFPVVVDLCVING